MHIFRQQPATDAAAFFLSPFSIENAVHKFECTLDLGKIETMSLLILF